MTDERGTHDHQATPGPWDDDRGDVPGWVLITLMTAGLVIILWGVAGPLLQNVFTQAINRVTSF
ncbi:hypothetical protein [Clavibacter michiganensis]|uniref:Uncharacterized protein n=1 Tax=Clavibacter michiganensis TaxID=28447 RepID=A0A251YL16_9MICO|nr:hypothetical protein [Clavibacter michiganensis]OUE24738.1 hypothetical protein BFL37_08035 [Clavibacter michiganensis]